MWNAMRLGLVALTLIIAGEAPRPTTALAAHAPPLTTRRGIVAADHAIASEIGARVLTRGGNAIDAAAATALALGVVNPASSGIGGGGFAVVWVAAEKKAYVYDFRETGPAAIGPDDFRGSGGAIEAQRSRMGGLAVGVPGEIAGLHRLVTRHGRWSWRQVVLPSAALARDGFQVSGFLARAAGKALPLVPSGRAYDGLRALLAPGGTTIRRGDTLRRPALAATLLAIARGGPNAFYRGSVGADMVATVHGAGGVLTAADLAGYQVVERSPLWGSWRGLRLATMPLPSSGGVVLLEMLGILERTGIDLAALGAGSSTALHVIAEIEKHGFADRARLLGDDQDGAAISAQLLAPARLAELAARVSQTQVQPHERYGGAGVTGTGAGTADGGTSHLCVIDADGNAVALTTTVNGYFGAKLVTAGGVVLNNEIDDFAVAPGATNMFGLRQSEHNLVGPGKRPLSSMSPTLIFDGDRVVACVGGSGGPYIISNTFQAILNVFVFGMDVRAAVEVPRVHHQWEPNVLRVEPEIPKDVVDALVKRGHTVTAPEDPSVVQMVRVLADGTKEAASDPRKGGTPAAEEGR